MSKRKKSIKKSRKEIRGLGDRVEQFTEATGIKTVVDKISKATGVDCGCEARKEMLNKLFPVKKPECLLDEEYEYLDNFFSKTRNTIPGEDAERMRLIFNRVYRQNKQKTGCGSCVRDTIEQVRKVYEQY